MLAVNQTCIAHGSRTTEQFLSSGLLGICNLGSQMIRHG